MKPLNYCLCALALTLMAGCNRKIDTSKVQDLIKTSLDSKLAGKLDGQVVAVECPENMPIKKGDTFECTVTVGEHTLVASVTQQDAKGTVAWEITQGIVEMTIKSGTEELIAQYVEKNLGAVGAKVECPKTIEVKKGGEFECTTLIDGVTVTTHVEQQNDQGNVSYKLVGGVVFTEKLSIIVEAELGAKKIAAKVNCGTPIRLSKPGSTFECMATDSNGETAVIDVKVNDESGDVNWQIRQPTP